MTKREYVDTEWRTATYDVLGNNRDGYEVNDVYRSWGTITLRLLVETHNAGTDREFKSAYPSDKQIRESLGIRPRFRIDLDGDDTTIYVNLERNGYPLGEMECVSHSSLSPIRAIEQPQA